MAAIEDAVREWARGTYPTEAGVELLIRQGKAIFEGAPWIIDLEPLDRALPRMASIDVDKLRYEAGAWSSGEQRVIRIAASLLGGPPVDLAEDLSGLDRKSLALVLAAAAHADGSHEHSQMRINDDGQPVGFDRVGSLYPWPDEDPEHVASR